jgi:hypothetical protein
MSRRCYLGRHTPSIHSMGRGKNGGYAALCESCAVPLEREANSTWRAATPEHLRSRMHAHP